MAASTREVYLLLRARDEASRVVRGFSSELLRSAAAAQAAALRAEAVTKRQEAARLRAAGATRAQTASLMAQAKALDDEAKRIQAAERDHRRFAQSLTAVSGALQTLGIGFTIAGAAALGFLFSASKDWQEYQRQVALTRTQVDGFSASMQELGDIGLDVARRIPIAFEEIQPALYNIFSSTNANLKQSQILLEGFSKAAVAGQTDIQTASKGTIAIMNAYNIPFEKVNRVLDIQFELVRKGVGTYEEFANVFGRVVPSATRAGQSFETVAAMLAYMTRNGQSAAMASTSAARALEALTHPKTVERLEKMGVSVLDAKGNFLPLIDVLEQLRDRIMKLPPAERVGALFELLKGAGGTIQARRFIEQVLLRSGELEDFRDLLQSMGDASGVMESKFAEMSDTAAAKMQLLSNRWQVLKVTIGEAATPVLLQIVDVISGMLEAFNRLDPGTKNLITQFIAWGAIASVLVGILIMVLGVIAGLVAAFVAAGSEILVVIGVIAGVIAIVAAAAAGFVTLWKRSDELRGAFSGLKGAILDFWNNGAKPAFETLIKLWQDRVAPAAAKVADAIGSYLATAIGFVSGVIRDQLIPMLQWAVEWYHNNEESVNRAIGYIITFATWVAKLGGILLAVFVGTIGAVVVGSIMTLIGVIMGLVMAWTYTVDAAIAAAHWLQKTWNAVKDFVLGIWNIIKSSTETAWRGIMSILEAVWNTIRDTAVSWGNGIKDFVVGIWNILKFLTQTAWQGILSILQAIWSRIGGTVTSWGNNVKSFVTSAWNSVKSTTQSIWNAFYTIIKTQLDNAYNRIKSIMNSAKNVFSSAGKWLYNAGRAIIQGLIDGITSKINALTSKLKGVTNTIKSFLPFSPAKRGPLSGRGNPYYSGQAIANLVAKGIWNKAGQVEAAAAMLARQFSLEEPVIGSRAPITGQTAFARVGVGSQEESASRIVNTTINVYTQEIDPKRQAAELGFLLEGKLG